MMIVPGFLKQGDTIGVTAMSHPIDQEADRYRFRNGARQLEEAGYKVIFTENVFAEADRYGRSSSGEQKAREFQSLVENPEVKAIYSASGGDFLAEMLPYVDLAAFKRNPKWVQGYSDNTSILYYLTTKGDIATAYGANFGDFGMAEWDLSVSRGLAVLEGRCDLQESFETYQDGFASRETGLEGYHHDAPVEWRCITDGQGNAFCDGTYGTIRGREDARNHDMKTPVSMQGRLLGGCLDVLLNLAGTPYDGTLEYLEKYKEDGIIWFLESFDLHFEQLMEGLWKLKELGWFRYAKGFIFGRPLFYPTEGWGGEPLPSYEEVLLERLAPLHVPIITGADVGHKGPQFVMVNGALAQVTCAGGRGSVRYL